MAGPAAFPGRREWGEPGQQRKQSVSVKKKMKASLSERNRFPVAAVALPGIDTPPAAPEPGPTTRPPTPDECVHSAESSDDEIISRWSDVREENVRL